VENSTISPEGVDGGPKNKCLGYESKIWEEKESTVRGAETKRTRGPKNGLSGAFGIEGKL